MKQKWRGCSQFVWNNYFSHRERTCKHLFNEASFYTTRDIQVFGLDTHTDADDLSVLNIVYIRLFVYDEQKKRANIIFIGFNFQHCWLTASFVRIVLVWRRSVISTSFFFSLPLHPLFLLSLSITDFLNPYCF